VGCIVGISQRKPPFKKSIKKFPEISTIIIGADTIKPCGQKKIRREG
jgi:hypothetical protein